MKKIERENGATELVRPNVLFRSYKRLHTSDRDPIAEQLRKSNRDPIGEEHPKSDTDPIVEQREESFPKKPRSRSLRKNS